jgi:hypothetical protein
MRKIKFIVAALSACVLLSSCLNIEERIVINNDNSGNYSLSIDMSKLMATIAQMGQSIDSASKNKKVDTTIALKGYIDTAKSLTLAEKALYRNSMVSIKMDMPDNIAKIKIECPFTTISDLAIVKKNLFSVISKLDVTKAAESSLTQGSSLPAGANLGAASQAGSPMEQFFTFTAAPGKISYVINNKAGLDKEMASDSIQQMKQMSMFMGDFLYSTVFVLPKEAKKFSGPGMSISDDKKTVIFKRHFDDLTDNVGNLEYKIEY